MGVGERDDESARADRVGESGGGGAAAAAIHGCGEYGPGVV